MAAKKTEQLLTYADLATRYGVSVGTVRQWANRGKLPAADFRVGQSPAWLESSLKDFTVTDLRASSPE